MAEKDRPASAGREEPAGSGSARTSETGAPGQARTARQWHYPSRDEHPEEQIFIYDKWCKSCGICYSMCPKGVLTSDKAGRPVVSHPDACIACGLCEILCPDMAITVHKVKATGGARSSAGDKAERDVAQSEEPGSE